MSKGHVFRLSSNRDQPDPRMSARARRHRTYAADAWARISNQLTPGSRFIEHHNQNSTVAAKVMAENEVCGRYGALLVEPVRSAMFAAEIRGWRVQAMRAKHPSRRQLAEVCVRINGMTHYL